MTLSTIEYYMHVIEHDWCKPCDKVHVPEKQDPRTGLCTQYGVLCGCDVLRVRTAFSYAT